MAKLSHVEARKARALEDLSAKIDLIMQKLGIEYQPAATAPVVEAEAEQAPVVEAEAAPEPKTRKGK